MGGVMKPTVFIFEEDNDLRQLLTLTIKQSGYQPYGFQDPFRCPTYSKARCVCEEEKPCADAMLISSEAPNKSIDFFIELEQKGCKLPRKNRAIMCSNFLVYSEEDVQRLGFTTFKKPFKVAEIKVWLRSCVPLQAPWLG